MDTLVTWDPEGVRAWAEASGEGAVMVHLLRGFVDAGNAGALAAAHLQTLSDGVRVATFDADQLIDYRSRRPEMVFSINQWTSYDAPELVLDMHRDAQGQAYLLLHGSEPDILWERYVSTIKEAVARLGVGLTVGAHGIPMAAPHTRPLATTLHGTRQDLLPDTPSFFGTVTVPGSAQSLLEYRFGQWGLDMVNVVVHVPYYLAQAGVPQSAQVALTALEGVTGLDFGTHHLDEAVRIASVQLEQQVRDNGELSTVVHTLEEQYDAFLAQRDSGIIDGPLPSADELGAEFEKFLAQQGKDLPPTP